ncbi:MAG: tetratricopeptide repeat protein, partial [Betaproteobacteria bacterium]
YEFEKDRFVMFSPDELKAGQLDSALDSYERCLAIDPRLADAHFNAARLHEQLGHAQKALRHFSAYRRLQR